MMPFNSPQFVRVPRTSTYINTAHVVKIEVISAGVIFHMVDKTSVSWRCDTSDSKKVNESIIALVSFGVSSDE